MPERVRSNARARRRPFLVVGAVLCAATIAFLGVRLLRPTKPDRSEQDSSQVQPREQHQIPTKAAPTEALPQPPSGPKTAVDDLRKESVEVARRLMEVFPNTPDTISVMAMAHFRFGNTTQAVKWFERCLEVDPTYAEAYHGLGWIALRKGKYQDAVSLLCKALEFDPTLAGASEYLAQGWMALGKPEEAASVLEEALDASGPSKELLYRLGDAYDHLNQYGEAKNAYLAAIELDPAATDAHYRLARVYKKLGEEDQSRVYLDKFKTLSVQDSKRVSARAGRRDDIGLVREDLADIYMAAGQVYQKHGDPRQAEKHWVKAAHFAPNDVFCLMQLASLYQQNGRLDKALDMFQRLADVEPDNAAYRMAIGSLYLQQERFDQAEQALKKACELAPRQPDGYRALVRLYLSSNRKISEAASLAETAVELAPTAANYVLLSAARGRNGDLAGALAAVDHAVKLEPDNAEYQRIRDSLKEPAE